MANQDWVLINIKQYCFDNSKKNDVEFFEAMLLGMLDSVTKIKVDGNNSHNYYDWYLCKKAYEHSKIIRKGERWPEAEKHIKKCAEIAYLYAKFVIKGRWPEAERYIKKERSAARKYAKYILKAPWKSAEKKIFDIGETFSTFGTSDSFDYVLNVTKKPNKKLENSIQNWFIENNDPTLSQREYMKKSILKDAMRYLKKVKKSQWKELEIEITKSPHIGEYWKIIKKDNEASDIFYNKVIIAAMMKENNEDVNYAKSWLKSNPRNTKDTAA